MPFATIAGYPRPLNLSLAGIDEVRCASPSQRFSPQVPNTYPSMGGAGGAGMGGMRMMHHRPPFIYMQQQQQQQQQQVFHPYSQMHSQPSISGYPPRDRIPI